MDMNYDMWMRLMLMNGTTKSTPKMFGMRLCAINSRRRGGRKRK